MARSSQHPHDNNSTESYSLHKYNLILLAHFRSRHIMRESSGHCKMVLVGSIASGVDIHNSDADILVEPTNVVIEESSLIYNRNDLPCYVRVSTNGLAGLVPDVLLGDGEYMRANPLRDFDEQIFSKTIHYSGKTTVGKLRAWPNASTDIVPQLRISCLPRTARSFAARHRSWPSDDIISLVIAGEFHLVARPAPLHTDPEHDFCLSFAKAEVVLIRTMSANQALTIMLLKRIRNSLDDGCKALTSYHLKTAAFWFFEQTDARLWENDLPIVDILERMDNYLNDSFLPHYFVPEMNLLAGESKSDLGNFRRILRSFLGFNLVTRDLTGVSHYTRLLLAVTIMECVKRELAESDHNSTETDDVHAISNIFIAAESLYVMSVREVSERVVNISDDVHKETSDVLYKTAKQNFSASFIEIFRAHLIIPRFRNMHKELRTSFNADVDGWLNSRHIKTDHEACESSSWIIQNMVNSTMEPLESVFGMNIVDHSTGGDRDVGREPQHSDHTIQKWLQFTDNILTMLKSQWNTLADHALVGISQRLRGDKHMTIDQCPKDIDSLLDEHTKKLLSFAVDNIRDLTSLDTDLYSFRSVGVGNARADVYTLCEVIERVLLPVEYALVRSVRLKSSDMAHGNSSAENSTSSECQCFATFILVKNVIQHYNQLLTQIYDYSGWVEFIVTTVRAIHDANEKETHG